MLAILMTIVYIGLLFMSYTTDILMPCLNPALALGASFSNMVWGLFSFSRLLLVYYPAPVIGAISAYGINKVMA